MGSLPGVLVVRSGGVDFLGGRWSFRRDKPSRDTPPNPCRGERRRVWGMPLVPGERTERLHLFESSFVRLRFRANGSTLTKGQVKNGPEGYLHARGKPNGKDFEGESRNIKIQEANTRLIRRAHTTRHSQSV